VIPLPASLKLFGGGASTSVPAATVATATATTGGSVGGSLAGALAGSAVAKFAAATLIGATAVGVGYASLALKAPRPVAATRTASNAATRGAPAGVHLGLPGHGGLRPASIQRPSVSHRHIGGTAGRGIASRRASGSPSTGAGLAASSLVPHGARGNGHVTGVRAHGHRGTTTSPAMTTPAAARGVGRPQLKPHKTHPTQSHKPKPPPPPTTTPSPSPSPQSNHGVGNGNGNGNTNH